MAYIYILHKCATQIGHISHHSCILVLKRNANIINRNCYAELFPYQFPSKLDNTRHNTCIRVNISKLYLNTVYGIDHIITEL